MYENRYIQHGFLLQVYSNYHLLVDKKFYQSFHKVMTHPHTIKQFTTLNKQKCEVYQLKPIYIPNTLDQTRMQRSG